MPNFVASHHASPATPPTRQALASQLASLRDALPEARPAPVIVDDSAQHSYPEAMPSIVAPIALLGTFLRSNPGEFHAADGSGHAFWAEQVIALDARNPQVAARMARALENWRRFTPALQASIRPQLERVVGADGLSPDVAEIVGKALEQEGR